MRQEGKVNAVGVVYRLMYIMALIAVLLTAGLCMGATQRLLASLLGSP
ncbi:MAG TPA: hypothetical protein VKT32_03035 [Chthonomonadaceae bacterium]|nr:hypothetical protein [Chthonomonadaceae bacterium]